MGMMLRGPSFVIARSLAQSRCNMVMVEAGLSYPIEWNVMIKFDKTIFQKSTAEVAG